MRIFVAASYSAKVDYETGEVFPEYRAWLEALLTQLESLGHVIFCSLRDDKYRINSSDPGAAFKLDVGAVSASDVLLALLDNSVSAGVQTEIGYALAASKKVLLAHESEYQLAYINNAMVRAGLAHELMLPFDLSVVQRLLATSS